MNMDIQAAHKFKPGGPADHARQAHFHGKVIGVGLVIVADVWKEVFARLNCNWRGAILLFLQAGLFRRIPVNQLNSDLCGRKRGKI